MIQQIIYIYILHYTVDIAHHIAMYYTYYIVYIIMEQIEHGFFYLLQGDERDTASGKG